MANAYGDDLRRRVIAAVDGGMWRSAAIFIDESGANTKMARLRGRAPRGERCRAAVPVRSLEDDDFVGALRLHGMTAPMVLDGPMNGPAFLAYVEQVLVPTLAPGETVIMDNANAHAAAWTSAKFRVDVRSLTASSRN